MDGSSAKVPDLIRPAGRRFAGTDRRAPLRKALQETGAYHDLQVAGRFFPISCVSLEITQRCNLDCTLCYLSDAAEMAHDVPMPVLLDRIEMIHSHFGPGTSIQISGGDPTLRAVPDLVALCRTIRAKGMRSCLMTNGIRATRPMLTELAEAGLDDVAFHVDLTQERKCYATEAALNAVRAAYIDRARGLGLRILFNTTVYEGNLSEIPAIARFFRDRAEDLTLISFQLQADTGRGVLRARDDEVTQASVMRGLSSGIGAEIDFDGIGIGPSECNRYGAVAIAGGHAVSLLNNPALAAGIVQALETAEHKTDGHLDIARTVWRVAMQRPWLALRGVGHILRRLWQIRSGIVKARGRISRLSVLVHNFMDGDALDLDRCRGCVFMVATADGPLSMCVHNARRDQHLFAPARHGSGWWSAATGETTDTPQHLSPGDTPRKLLKGRLRAAARSATKPTDV
ncbi:MAG: radical SAM protein [Pseudomonadota bacterium]